ncbi:MAG: DUF512 domain-containing protein [Nitrospirota bacterium]
MPPKNSCGIEIEAVTKGSRADKAGLRAGDRLIEINGNRIHDAIDLMFYGSEPELEFLVARNNERMRGAAGSKTAADELGIVLKSFKTRSCRNNCIFCFVAQLPKGMRKPLYLKDDDYRMSFLFGNYVTLTNCSADDRKRIVEQRLSPLYISVHSTDREIRNRLLGSQQAGDILKEIKFLAEHNIRMHTQIVLCPGYNDGKELRKTITDLYRFYPYVMSVAVVPVGLTAHRKKSLRPVERDDALQALEIIHKFQARFKRKHGESIVYGADELYIKAGIDTPPLKEYGELPQIENGVGLVPLFLHQMRKVRIPKTDGLRRFITFTGVSFYPFLSKFVAKLKRGGIDIEAVAVENTFFGSSVTVTGLLTGRDVIKALSGRVQRNDILLIPDVVMREGDEVFLDDVSRQDIEDVLGIEAHIIEATPKGIVETISKLA